MLFTALLVGIIAELPQIIFLLATHFQGIKTVSKETAFIVMSVQFIYGLIVGAFLYLSLYFAVDNINNPFKAVGNSFHATKGRWLKIIGIVLITYLIMAIFYAPLFLGGYLQNKSLVLAGFIILLVAFVWLLPFLFLVQARVYHKLAD